MEQIPSGGSVKINNNEHYIPVRLRIKRANFSGSDVVPELITSITLNNGFEDTIVKIHFCETILFYKDGIGYNMFDPDNATATKMTVNSNGDVVPSISNVTTGDQKYISFSSPDKRLMWVYNPDDAFRAIPENKVVIDYSKNVRLYFRVLYLNGERFRFLNLADNPQEYYESIPGLGSVYNHYNTRTGLLKYFRQWPSRDGCVISHFYSFANCYPKDVICEKRIAVGGTITAHIAEIGLIKYNYININDWQL